MEQANKVFINVIYGIMFFLTMVLFFISYFVNRENIDIPVLGSINPSLRINVEIPKEDIQNVHFYINNREIKPYIWRNPNTYCAFEISAKNVYSITFKGDRDEDISKIGDIVVFVGDKMFYYDKNDVSNFKKTKDGRYIFPPTMKYYKNSIYINDAGGLKHLTYGILSVFYNWKFYLIPFLFLFITCLIYEKNKDKINLGFNLFKQNAIWLILIFAFLVRVCDLGFNFWSDELYTLTHSSWPDSSFIWTFKDPGNPPFFYILAKIWMMIFGYSEIKCRMLNVLISTATVYFIYIFLKDNLDIKNGKKIALIAAFLSTINLYSIQGAQDFRAYALGGMFCILSAYYLFEIIKNGKTKNYLIYSILTACMINTHYFQALILLANFIYANIFLNNKERVKFFIANLVGSLFFLPFFIMTALHGAFLNKKFYYGYETSNFSDVIFYFSEFFTSYFVTITIITILFLFLIPKLNKKIFNSDEKLKKILVYAFYLTCFVFVTASLISNVRPMIKGFYYTNIIPMASVILAIVCMLPYKKKIFTLWCSIIILCMFFSGKMYYNKTGLSMITFDPIVNYMRYDSVKYRKQNKKIAIFMHDSWKDVKNELEGDTPKNSDNYLLFYLDKLHGDETVITYTYGEEAYIIKNMLKLSNIDVAYMRLQNKKFVKFSMELEDEYKISVIRCNKDIIVGRFEKK